MPLLETKGASSAQGFGEFALSAAANYIEDVFSTYLYTGNSSTQTITNGIDLAVEGGLVWTKARYYGISHRLVDTARGATYEISSDTTDAQSVNSTGLTSFGSTGYTIGSAGGYNNSGGTYVGWTFRKQPKFFDVVTYTGNSTARTISHSLGSAPGCIIVKATSASGYQWAVYHRSLVAGNIVWLNLTDASTASSNTFTTTAPTATEFSLGTASGVNDNGVTYVAYLFAHDAGGFGLTGTDNVISCGSFVGGGGSAVTVNLGYEPQWLLIKNASSLDDWFIVDNMRGWSQSQGVVLKPNTSGAEQNYFGSGVNPTATGFYVGGGNFGSGANVIYIAIRRGPMKVPTDGTKVFSPALGTSASTIPTFVTNFPVDLGFYHSRANTADWYLSSRLQGGGTLNTNTTFAEAAPDANYAFDSNTGWGKNFNSDKASSNFRRAPGFFDEVCYTGTSSATTQAHNLGAVPELIIVKSRNAVNNWPVYSAATGSNYALLLNTTGAVSGPDSGDWNNTTPTSSVFSLGGNGRVNASGNTYVAYLFASCPGVSKVGSVTHVEPTTVSCGFTPRFVLIKSTTATGTDDWFVFDSARGITAGNDPYLRLNSTGAENTPFGAADLIDPTADGFIMNGFSGGNYIFLAIA